MENNKEKKIILQVINKILLVRNNKPVDMTDL